MRLAPGRGCGVELPLWRRESSVVDQSGIPNKKVYRILSCASICRGCEKCVRKVDAKEFYIAYVRARRSNKLSLDAILRTAMQYSF
jgi:hypothetical protein